jgi:hypothetical protein
VTTNRSEKLGLLLLTAFIVTARAQQKECPIQIQKIQWVHSEDRTLLPNGPVSANQERTLRITYKNVATKPVSTGTATAGIVLSVESPTHTASQVGSQKIILESLRIGHKKSVSLEVLSSPALPKVRLTQVSFADGSSWSANEPSSCVYTPKHEPIKVGLAVPVGGSQ